MHTNIDKTHLNRFVVEKILGFKIENQNEFIANCNIDMSFENLLKYLNEKLNLKNIKFVKTKRKYKNFS